LAATGSFIAACHSLGFVSQEALALVLCSRRPVFCGRVIALWALRMPARTTPVK
jgi:hypothetical protein